MVGQTPRWMQHGACIGLMMMVASACASGPGLPAAAKPASAVQQQPATAGTRVASASQKSAESKATQAKDAASDEKPKPIDLCTLATADEMTGILGALKAGPVPLKGPSGETLSCVYTGVNGQEVTLFGESPLSFGTIKYGTTMNGTHEPVSGFGNEALFGKAKQGDIYTLVISTDRVALTIALQGDVEKAQALAITEAVATKALARV